MPIILRELNWINNIKNGVAKELKSGYFKMTKEFQKQVKKDIDIFIEAVGEIVENPEENKNVRLSAFRLSNSLLEFKFINETVET